MIQLALAETDLAREVVDAEAATSYHVQPKNFSFLFKSDAGEPISKDELASVMKTQKGFGLPIKARNVPRQHVGIPSNVAPAPLRPLTDTCAQADSVVHNAMAALDTSAEKALSTLTAGGVDLSGCVTKHHYSVAAAYDLARALAEHQEGNSGASVDAELASQDYMKCAEVLYGTREGAECKILGMKATEAQATWTMGY